MKTQIKNPFLLPALIAVLNLIPAGRVTAQTFTTLHSFTGGDGANPQGGLVTNSSGNILYGTALYGGGSGRGTVFAVNTDGTGFTNLHSFTGGSDGAFPYVGLILSGNILYGTAAEGGGGSGRGKVFAVNTDGTGFTTLHSFNSGSDGAYPGGLILSGNTLYGTATEGGSSGAGTVFAVNTNGTSFTNLHSFTAASTNSVGAYTNSDGINPYAGLILSGSTLYGTANAGGSSGKGTVFAVNINGTGFTTLHSFIGASDGASPYGDLIVSGNTLYGVAAFGGGSGNGTVFVVNTNGTAFTNLYSFTATLPYPNNTNSDGAYPYAGLILSGNTLYGTALNGGRSGVGTMFAVNTDGTGFTTLHNFTLVSDGASPYAGLILSGNTLYGTANRGGSAGKGTVFSLSFRPQLTITASGIPPSGIILYWPTNVAGFDYTGFTLQSTPNLTPPVTWLDVTNPPAVLGGQFTVTNAATGGAQFFRLRKL